LGLIPSVVNESSASIREGDWTYVPSVVTVLGVSHARIIQYHGTDTHVTVPATIGGQPVFEIVANKYRNRRKQFGLRMALICGIINFETRN
jgi:hypothetical protein